MGHSECDKTFLIAHTGYHNILSPGALSDWVPPRWRSFVSICHELQESTCEIQRDREFLQVFYRIAFSEKLRRHVARSFAVPLRRYSANLMSPPVNIQYEKFICVISKDIALKTRRSTIKQTSESKNEVESCWLGWCWFSHKERRKKKWKKRLRFFRK